MEMLSESVDGGLYWIQSEAGERSFELRAGERLFATLHFKTTLGSMAVLESGNGRWVLRRSGFWNPRITVQEVETEALVAAYRRKILGLGGILEFLDGQIFHWRPVSVWGKVFRFLDWSGNEIVSFNLTSQKSEPLSALKRQAHVEISADIGSLPAVPLLVSLGWYLFVLQEDGLALMPPGVS